MKAFAIEWYDSTRTNTQKHDAGICNEKTAFLILVFKLGNLREVSTRIVL